MKRGLLVVLVAIVVVSLLTLMLLLRPANSELAIANAISFFENEREPYAMLMLDVIFRRFGIETFANASQIFNVELAIAEIERPYEARLLRVFRRIIDYSNQLQIGDLEAVSDDIDLITVPALYSDRNGLSPEYPELLDEALRRGQYLIPHVLLAWIWIQENNYEWPKPEGFIETVINSTSSLAAEDSPIDDLNLEAAAFLCLAGQQGSIADDFIERVLAAQNNDGGWSYINEESGDSDWHPTVLALLLLLHLEHPSDSYPPMLATPIS